MTRRIYFSGKKWATMERIDFYTLDILQHRALKEKRYGPERKDKAKNINFEVSKRKKEERINHNDNQSKRKNSQN